MDREKFKVLIYNLEPHNTNRIDCTNILASGPNDPFIIVDD